MLLCQQGWIFQLQHLALPERIYIHTIKHTHTRTHTQRLSRTGIVGLKKKNSEGIGWQVNSCMISAICLSRFPDLRKDSTINYPAADSWQPLNLLKSALLLVLQRLTFENSLAGFSRVRQSPPPLLCRCTFCYPYVLTFTTDERVKKKQPQLLHKCKRKHK